MRRIHIVNETGLVKDTKVRLSDGTDITDCLTKIEITIDPSNATPRAILHAIVDLDMQADAASEYHPLVTDTVKTYGPVQ